MAEPTHLFTVEEANGLLPRVEPLVAEMRQAAIQARRNRPLVERFAARAAASGGARPSRTEQAGRRRLFSAEARVAGAVEALDALGLWVKDAERGLLDFPSER